MTITDTTTAPDALLSLQHRYDDLLALHNKWRNDFEKVAAALRDEAIERGWCSEYGEWIEKVNRNLELGELLPAQRNYTVQVHLTVEYEAAPGNQGQVANDIVEAIYHHGDNLNNVLYQISGRDYDEPEEG